MLTEKAIDDCQQDKASDGHLEKNRKQKNFNFHTARKITGIIFVLPAVLLFAIFVIYPAVDAVRLSFFKIASNGNETFIGLENFKRIFSDKWTLLSIWNTFKIMLICVPSTLIISLFVAATIYQKKQRITSLYRCIFYLAVIASAVTVSLMWNWIFNAQLGIANYLLKLVNLPPQEWLGGTNTSLGCIMVVVVYMMVGQPVIIYTAALEGLSRESYEASEIDGANKWQQFLHISLPMLQPVTLYIMVISTINAFQTFVPVNVLTQGGPQGKTATMVFSLYEEAFLNFDYGYASSIGTILLIVIGVFSVAQFKINNIRHQEGQR
jgi:multiple sugar transport system permease protein